MVLCAPSDWPARVSDLEEHSLSGFPSPVPLAHSLRSSGAAGHRPQCGGSVLREAAPVACSWPGTSCSAQWLAVGLLMQAIRPQRIPGAPEPSPEPSAERHLEMAAAASGCRSPSSQSDPPRDAFSASLLAWAGESQRPLGTGPVRSGAHLWPEGPDPPLRPPPLPDELSEGGRAGTLAADKSAVAAVTHRLRQPLQPGIVAAPCGAARGAGGAGQARPPRT